MIVFLLVKTLMVRPFFYFSTLVLILYSTHWPLRWNGCSGYRGLYLHISQPDSNLSSVYAKNGG